MNRFTLTLFLLLVAIVIGSLFIQNTSLMSQTQISNMKSPKIVITKSKRALDVFDSDKLIKTYKIVLGFAPVGDKEIEGDGRTPEGEFYVFTKNAKSNFHVSLGISYPSLDDAKRGIANELISSDEADEIVKATASNGMPPQKTALGGEIYIHGGGTEKDWTDGCVALKDVEIKELFDAVPVGTKVKIVP